MFNNGVLATSRPVHWTRLDLAGDQIPARSSHSATLVADTLIIFGGFANDQERHDFCHVKTDTLYCCIVEPSGTSISKDLARVGHSAICMGKSLYIFGGWNGHQYCNDGILYDVKSMEISFPENKSTKADRPSARRDHACAVVNNHLYLFAGWNCVDQFNDMWRLDSSWRWTLIQCSGSIPVPRRGHTANALGPYIFVFGGIYGLTHYLGDLYVFNTTTNQWSKIPLKGDPPKPRAWHTASIVGKFLIVIGGTAGRRHFYNDVHVLDTSTMIWYQLQTSGSVPEPRASHSATLINNQIVIFGGITPSSLENVIYPLDSMFALNVDIALIESTGFTPADIFIDESAKQD